MVDIRQTTADYLDVMRLALLQGRWLTSADTRGSELVVVLNDVAARRYLGSEEHAVGGEVRFQLKSWKVVGVVRGVRLGGPESDVRPEAYVSLTQSPIIGGSIVIRTSDDPLALIPAVQAVAKATAPGPPAVELQALDALFGGLIATRRFNMLLLSTFGILGVAIAAIGVYGVMAFLVAQRTHDIGVRMALGADRGTVLRSVLWQACRYLLIGLSIGFMAASSLAGLVESLLFRVAPNDVGVYTAVGAVILFAGLIAAWIPARRAARVDPLVALRVS
jgi:putative ABC transport system permease protein